MMKTESNPLEKMTVGWQEWCALSLLDIPKIKVKIDTGAKTSALHAFNIKLKKHEGQQFVYFSVHPKQGNITETIQCKALVIDQRYIMSSNGHKEYRYIIQTSIQLGHQSWPIELSLSKRDPLKFRMILGREAMQHHVIVDPAKKLLQKLKKQKRRSKTI
jgi:ribosomal protein S6--L-glutamate ligase